MGCFVALAIRGLGVTTNFCIVLISLSFTMALQLVSPSKDYQKTPLLAFRQCWKSCKSGEQETFDCQPWKEDFEEFLTVSCLSGPCFDLHNPTRRTSCCCMQELDLTDEEKDSLFNYLVMYFKMGFEEQRRLILEWKRC